MSSHLLPVQDRFEIFEQLQLHQACIDNDASMASTREHVDLYWPADLVQPWVDEQETSFKGS